MFPKTFEYYQADTIDEAIDLLKEHADSGAALLSGGHSLLPTMKSGLASPPKLIDIGEIEALRGIELEDDRVRFGALTTYASIADSEVAWEQSPAVAAAAHEIGDIQVRNRGTIGGNIAHADPASDLPAAVLASKGTLSVRGPDGSRDIAADDFFKGLYETALAPDELLVEITVPALKETEAGVYIKKPSPSSGYALVGVAVVLSIDGERIKSARVAATGALDHATRLTAVEQALVGRPIDERDWKREELRATAERATEGFELEAFMSDLQTSSEFRAHLLEMYTERALAEALKRAVTIN